MANSVGNAELGHLPNLVGAHKQAVRAHLQRKFPSKRRIGDAQSAAADGGIFQLEVGTVVPACLLMLPHGTANGRLRHVAVEFGEPLARPVRFVDDASNGTVDVGVVSSVALRQNPSSAAHSPPFTLTFFDRTPKNLKNHNFVPYDEETHTPFDAVLDERTSEVPSADAVLVRRRTTAKSRARAAHLCDACAGTHLAVDAQVLRAAALVAERRRS